jgi:hypothetical protein
MSFAHRRQLNGRIKSVDGCRSRRQNRQDSRKDGLVYALLSKASNNETTRKTEGHIKLNAPQEQINWQIGSLSTRSLTLVCFFRDSKV